MKLFKSLLILTVLIPFMGCEKEEVAMIENSKFFVSSSTLNFNETNTHELVLSVVPSDTCSFEVLSHPSWINVSPTKGLIEGGAIVTITSLASETAGQYSGSIKIQTKFGESSVSVEQVVTESVAVQENYVLNLPDSVIIDEFTDFTNFSFFNEEIVAIDWELTTTDDFLTVEQNTGVTEADTEEVVDIVVNRETFETGNYYSNIILTSGAYTDTIPVRIYNFKEYKIKLQEDIVDAAYIKSKDAIVYASSNPLALFYYDVVGDMKEQIDLTYVPTSLALDKSGAYAVVGHDAHVTYVDLVNKTIINTFDISAKAIDIVFADNGWAYCSVDDYDDNLIGINLSTGDVVRHTAYSSSSRGKIKLDNTGNYIYLADQGVTPSDLHKYSIENDTAVYMYDSQYHGDYSISGNLWLSEDGNRIFSRGGSVFKTSTVESNDMVYNGELDLYQEAYHVLTSVFDLEHNALNQEIYLLGSRGYDKPKYPYLFIHNHENLLLKDKIGLEKYITRDGQGGGSYYEPDPYFVFLNNAGNEAFVITKAYESGLLYEWAIEKISLP
ncbi:hypothetical protein WJR50_33710 [Catalinimonas sp. 4WD22]|uniref:BACON domain-containing protein n=1 Tax=Catalinimonas locisalis TaxID=3133978 RepID=UPI003101B044